MMLGRCDAGTLGYWGGGLATAANICFVWWYCVLVFWLSVCIFPNPKIKSRAIASNGAREFQLCTMFMAFMAQTVRSETLRGLCTGKTNSLEYTFTTNRHTHPPYILYKHNAHRGHSRSPSTQVKQRTHYTQSGTPNTRTHTEKPTDEYADAVHMHVQRRTCVWYTISRTQKHDIEHERAERVELRFR